MFRELPASRPARSFRRGEWTGIIGASVFHAGLLLLAAAPSADPAPVPERDTIPIVFTPERAPISEPDARVPQSDGAASFVSPSPVEWPEGAIPEIDLDSGGMVLRPSAAPRDLFTGAGHARDPWAGLSAGGGGAGGGVASERALVLPLRLEVAPNPRYPEWLRRAGITGSVSVEFVVDTTGRVETGSIEVLQATRDEFAGAVIRALEDARFSPGSVRGRRVRVKVRQDFRFRIGD